MLLFPGTVLFFDFLNQCFELLGNFPPLNLLILRTRAAFDRCGALVSYPTMSATFVGTVELSSALQCCFQRFVATVAVNNTEEGEGD